MQAPYRSGNKTYQLSWIPPGVYRPVHLYQFPNGSFGFQPDESPEVIRYIQDHPGGIYPFEVIYHQMVILSDGQPAELLASTHSFGTFIQPQMTARQLLQVLVLGRVDPLHISTVQTLYHFELQTNGMWNVLEDPGYSEYEEFPSPPVQILSNINNQEVIGFLLRLQDITEISGPKLTFYRCENDPRFEKATRRFQRFYRTQVEPRVTRRYRTRQQKLMKQAQGEMSLLPPRGGFLGGSDFQAGQGRVAGRYGFQE